MVVVGARDVSLGPKPLPAVTSGLLRPSNQFLLGCSDLLVRQELSRAELGRALQWGNVRVAPDALQVGVTPGRPNVLARNERWEHDRTDG